MALFEFYFKIKGSNGLCGPDVFIKAFNRDQAYAGLNSQLEDFKRQHADPDAVMVYVGCVQL